MPAAPEDWLTGGRVGRPHGLDGSFHVTHPRPALLTVGAAVRIGEHDTEIVRRAGTDERPIVRVAGVEGREGAEAVRGTDLLVPRASAPPLEEDEWWATDLVGCRVVDGEREVGSVARLIALPSCEALEVTGAGPEFLVPLVRDAVRSVDVAAKRIDVDLAFLGDTAPALPGDDAPDAGPVDESVPSPDEAPGLALDDARSLSPDEAPAPAADEGPAPAADEAPTPAADEAPTPAADEAPTPAADEAPALTRDDAPVSTRDGAPASTRHNAPALIRDEAR